MPSSSKLNRGIVLAVVGEGGWAIEFYSFDQSPYPLRRKAEKYRRSRYIKVTPRLLNTNSLGTLKHNHITAGYAYCSSTGNVYRAGGLPYRCECGPISCFAKPLKQVDCWSLCDRGTHTLPEMNAGRCESQLLVVRGTVFAVGGRFSGCDEEKAFIEFYEQGNGRWVQVENPSNLVDMKRLVSGCFVCGAVEVGVDHYAIMIGSDAKEYFLGLDLHMESNVKGGKMKWKWNWRVTEVPFDKRLSVCYKSPPAIVSDSKQWMMWLDDGTGSELYVLYYVRMRYVVIDLVDLGALPLRKWTSYAMLVGLKSDEGDHFGVIWQDNSVYLPATDNTTYEVTAGGSEEERALRLGRGGGREEALTGFNLSTFKLVDEGVVLESRELCLAPGSGFGVVGVFNMDLTMGLSMSNLFSRVLDTKEKIRILIAGLGTSGKATIMRKLDLEMEPSYDQRIFLPSSNYKNISFTVTDGLSEALVRWCRSTQPQGIIFVVDSSNREQIRHARKFLHKMLKIVGDAALLIFCNKQDLPTAMDVDCIMERLHLHSYKCNWHIQSCCATSGEGLFEGLIWLSSNITI